MIPVLDTEIIQQAYAQLFPGSIIGEEFNEVKARFELRGYLMDVLNDGLVTPVCTEER